MDIVIATRDKKDIKQKLLETLKESRKKQGLDINISMLKEQVDMFLDNPQRMRHADKLMESMWEEYKNIAYYVIKPKKGRIHRNNKIIEMSYEVLTHESAAEKVLSPGGFEAPKRLGYMVEAYRNTNLTWEELQSKPTSELKDLCSIAKNIGFVDTQIQYYTQNAAASTILGIFAVHRTAHAVLEGDGYQIDIAAAAQSTNTFNIAGFEFSGIMPFDIPLSSDGKLVSKTLGSFVAASADAAKEPALNLMNINNNTVNILTTLIRMGVPFEDAGLFLSQKIIADILTKYNIANIDGYKSLSTIISEELKPYNFVEDSPINSEPLTREEMIEGIKDNEPRAVYKTLLIFKKVLKLANVLSGPTYATRFNSISNAVGPLVIDNLIMEHKMEEFAEEAIINSNGMPIKFNDILERHPILQHFATAPEIARNIMQASPGYSYTFESILNTLPDNMRTSIMRDRATLNKLLDFFLSYSLVASGVINPSKCEYYIDKFPAKFISENFKEKYPDNLFIQAINMKVDPKTKRLTLNINTTGLDKADTERLSAGWSDLHKIDPELSMDLFKYCFFKGGIGFNPKAFMGLLPNYVKEHIENYISTYENIPNMNPAIVADQFIRNNYRNNRLVPTKKDVNMVPHDTGIIEVMDSRNSESYKNILYFKTRAGNTYTVWRQIKKYKTGEDSSYFYEKVDILGNSGEFLEISNNNIKNSIVENTFTVEEESGEQVQTNPVDGSQEHVEKQELTDAYITDVLYKILMNTRDKASAGKWIEKAKGFSKTDKNVKTQLSNYFSDRLNQLNIETTPELVNKLFEKIGFC